MGCACSGCGSGARQMLVAGRGSRDRAGAGSLNTLLGFETTSPFTSVPCWLGNRGCWLPLVFGGWVVVALLWWWGVVFDSWIVVASISQMGSLLGGLFVGAIFPKIGLLKKCLL